MSERKAWDTQSCLAWLDTMMDSNNRTLRLIQNGLRTLHEFPETDQLNSLSRSELLLQAQQLLIQVRDMIRTAAIYSVLTECEDYINAICVLRLTATGMIGRALGRNDGTERFIDVLHTATHGILSACSPSTQLDAFSHPELSPETQAALAAAAERRNDPDEEVEIMHVPDVSDDPTPPPDDTVEARRKKLVNKLKAMMEAEAAAAAVEDDPANKPN